MPGSPLEISALPGCWPSDSQLSSLFTVFYIFSSIFSCCHWAHWYQLPRPPLLEVEVPIILFFLKQIFIVCLLCISYCFRDIKYSKINKQEISVLKELSTSWGRHLVFSLSTSQRPGRAVMLRRALREHRNIEGSWSTQATWQSLTKQACDLPHCWRSLQLYAASC